VADAGEGGELVVGGDELAGALGRRPPTISSASPQMNKIGTLVGPIAWRVPRARYQASAAAIAGGLPITDKCAAIAASGTPFRASRVRTQAASSASSRGPAAGSRNSRWCRERYACSPSGIASARANEAGCGRDSIVSEASRSG
jgi:hypothetical protein